MGAETPGLARLFAALGDPTRLALVGRLAGGAPCPVARLAEGLPLTRQAVAKHLAVLEAADLVIRTRVGRETRVSLRPARLEDAATWIAEIEKNWDGALARLRDHLSAE